ncbi:MAG TPA: hypothetical protein VFZ32_10140 [Micromonosporaceae bacterium]
MAEKTVVKTAGRATRGPAGKPTGKPAGPDPAGKADPGPARTPADTAARNTETLAPEPLVVLAGLEKVAPTWWAAVGRVYDALLDDDTDLDTVSAAFHEELVARFQYAKALHEQGYRVPDYLAERAPISPLWPLPEVPTLVRQATRAA